MIIISIQIFITHIIMKKISLIIIWIFTILSVMLRWNISFAQENTNTGGIYLNTGCLKWMWKWCFDYEKMIWIEKVQNQNITTTTIAQDVLLSATYMVWTVLTIVIIFCWLMYIFAARNGKSDVNKYKTWLINAGIWALLVRWAYTIVRLVQYIAKW